MSIPLRLFCVLLLAAAGCKSNEITLDPDDEPPVVDTDTDPDAAPGG